MMNMKITEDIIIDLLPAYQSGEASEDTRLLVETYLTQHPEFNKVLAVVNENLDVLVESHPQLQKEKETIMRVKNMLRLRSIFLGLALFCTVMPFSVAGNSQEGITWFMMRDSPALAALFGVGAVCVWFAYLWSIRAVSD